MSTVCTIHTGISTFAPLQALAADLMPHVEFMHIVEDTMIKDVMKAGGPDADVSARIAHYVTCADRAHCDTQILMVQDGVANAARDSDVLVLAQASMARALAGLAPLPMPVLTSPESGMRHLKGLLDGLAAR